MCGIVIEGKHSCEVEVSKIQIVECDFVRSRDKNNDCQICIVKENERKFEDQWREDEDGYCYCSFCGDKSYWGLPKQCCCKAYVGNDGLEKCKSCQKIPILKVENSLSLFSHFSKPELLELVLLGQP